MLFLNIYLTYLLPIPTIIYYLPITLLTYLLPLLLFITTITYITYYSRSVVKIFGSLDFS